ncbi:FCHSD2 [Cordylochernes scorpioides]|uniref:FCHSD2 n=1 Tax=Cordylochernes scorpioides TaxID=51811 RepID=A0ABY6LIW4_9ARAC|nr:FCHSD2 [Cordylochernes scorpioides]
MNYDCGGIMWFEDEDYQEASPFFTCRSPAQQLLYYSLSNLPPSGPDTPPLVFTNLEDVLDAAARNPGSKIKVFHDEISAIQYSYLHYSTQGTVPLVELRSNGEAQLPFRAPSKQDLMKFRKTIEQGDLETFLRYLWCNPRFLVSEGDTAVILQEGFRYNALHVAVKAKQPSFCEYILNTVTSRRFLRLLYPQDDDVTLQNRIFILADQYLNTPEKGRLETPLHFAAKFGCFHCCRCLLMYHQCDKTRRNKDGETAHDVVCSREGSPDLKKKIQDLFTSEYWLCEIAEAVGISEGSVWNILHEELGRKPRWVPPFANAQTTFAAIFGPIQEGSD